MASRLRTRPDEHLRRAITKPVEIVGEAAKQVTPATRLAHAGGEWSAAARMRDRLIHHYFSEEICCRALLVHAESEDARAFYLHLIPEFEASPTDPLHLVLLLKDIKATLRSLDQA